MLTPHGIAWLNIPGYKGETLNPVSGCSKVSEGCANCYAERLFPRVYSKDKEPDGKARKFSDVREHPDRLAKIDKWVKPRAIFVNSMSDLFHEAVDWDLQSDLFEKMMLNPRHIFIILTKRPVAMRMRVDQIYARLRYKYPQLLRGPLPNVWLGVSAENQASADKRIPILMSTTAAKKIISLEPMLGPVDFRLVPSFNRIDTDVSTLWVVVGGESGFYPRKFDPEWARLVLRLCRNAGVPFFMKQVSGVKKKDRDTIPEDLMVREFP